MGNTVSTSARSAWEKNFASEMKKITDASGAITVEHQGKIREAYYPAVSNRWFTPMYVKNEGEYVQTPFYFLDLNEDEAAQANRNSEAGAHVHTPGLSFYTEVAEDNFIAVPAGKPLRTRDYE